MSGQAGKPLIHLRIESTAGGFVEHDYNPNEPIRAIKISAMGQLHLDPSAADKYRLVYNGQELPEDKKLGESGVPDGATLILAPISIEVI